MAVVSATFGRPAIASSGSLKLARAFTDNAVFQRGQTFPVFGEDVPGTNVSVTFAGQTLNTVSDANGHWRVNLAPLALNATPQSLTVTGSRTVTFTNILVGDVWLISGQSNADFPLRSATGGSAAIASATNTFIRYLHLAESPRTDAVAWSPAEVARLNPDDYFSGAWQVNDPSSAGVVSAVGYFFTRHIQTNQNVPIGLIDCTAGGTRAESWLPTEAINAHPRLAAIADDFLNSDMVAPFAKTRLLQNLAHWNAAGRPAPMPEHPYKPGACWRNGLGTLAPFALRGVLWYQGETDADFSNPADFERMARWHTGTFTTLVAAWRRSWENPALPVYFVQLPQMNRPSWPWFRESQRQCALTISNTAMAVAYEYGEPNNVHPANKEPMADRLALVARACSYGENVEWSGPTLRSWSTHSNRLILQFDHATGGLISSDAQPLRLFEVAGTNGHCFSATAVISSNTIILSAPEVLQPVAARYAWSPTGSVNFYNGAGLPASPFRTDND
ncbi:MAG TPA: sialate O-acetylesterase [Verrucomicrobiae bacterium]|nr:sialate O-acetylesterase [Verrucomicrobiae bacterium]